IECVLELAVNERLSGGQTAIDKNGAENCFKGVGKGGSAVASTVRFLAATKNEVFAEAERAALFGKRAAGDRVCAGPWERAFVERGEMVVEIAREDELDDSVAEKLEALIVLSGRAVFVRDGGMSQGELEKRVVAEIVTQAFLKFAEVSHRRGAVIQPRWF